MRAKTTYLYTALNKFRKKTQNFKHIIHNSFTMIETFRSLDLMLQIYWSLAIIASVIFAIQAVMTFIGLDADTDIDTPDAPDANSDFDVDGFHLVSIKTIISFILGFGWTGVLCWNDIESPFLLALLATVVGFIFMAIIAYLLYLVLKLDRDNTFRVKNVIGFNAEVYLRIPSGGTDTGKIIVALNGSTHELEAVTTDTTDIPTGAQVKITGIKAGEVVVVEAF